MPGGTTQDLPWFTRSIERPGRGQPICTRIGDGHLGGKAQGLLSIRDALFSDDAHGDDERTLLTIPDFTVLATDVFDAFLERNGLYELALSGAPDERIAHGFQAGHMPTEVLGDLRSLISSAREPLAIRSSSLLEDALYRPFAGVYGTKMIPNNQPDAEARFRGLVEAIKYVYASTFFETARSYVRTTDKTSQDEKMAVLIQQVFGERHGERFYPHVSGVARSYNFYASGSARPEEGVISLALGLGKQIVDGGVCWSFSPAHHKAPPPFGSAREYLTGTQTRFWAVGMGAPPAYDPIAETEYLVRADLSDAEYDNTLRLIASTYVPSSDRIIPGTGPSGPRVVDFAPLLKLELLPLAPTLERVLRVCEDAQEIDIEMEFAVTLPRDQEGTLKLAVLQVRPMLVPEEDVELTDAEMVGEDVIVSSREALGNGIEGTVRDIVYVKPESFDAAYTDKMAVEVAERNSALQTEGRSYVLIGFGRWGSSDPWLGIPANWSQISAARAIVEATLPQMNIEMSQGSHFFHNLSSYGVSYFAVPAGAEQGIDWEWLNSQEAVHEADYVRHVRLQRPLYIAVDGRSSRGVIRRGVAER